MTLTLKLTYAMIALLVTVLPLCACAQSTAGCAAGSGDGRECTPEAPPSSTASVQQSDALAQTTLRSTVFVPALNGAAPIALDSTARPLLSYGSNLGMGWESSNLDGSSALVTASPYVTLQSVLASTEFILQYSPTFAKYTADNYIGGSLQRGTATALGTFSPRWRWNANTSVAHGQDSLRLITPAESVVVGDISAASPDAAIYRADAGVGTYVTVGTGVTYLKSERDALDLQLGESYNHFTGISGDSNILSAQISYIHKVSPTLSVNPYSQVLASTGYFSCTSFGAGAGLNWQVAERTGISLSAGPQISTKECGSRLGFVFSAALNMRINSVSQLYLLAGRQFSSPYLGPGLWENTAGAGYQRMLNRATAATVDLSYANSTGIGNVANYSGVFLDATVTRTIGRVLSPSLSYQRIMSNTGPTIFNMDSIIFSLSWSSNSSPLFN